MVVQVNEAEHTLTTRDKILEVAKKRMMHYGISKTTMNDIADELGMSVGALYLHFKNKDDIVSALAQSCRQEQDAVLQAILADDTLTPPQKLETFIIEKFRYVSAFRTETPHGKELIKYLVNKFPESVKQWEERFETALFSILDQGTQKGDFKIADKEQMARLIRLATMGFFPLPYLELPVYPEEDQLRQLVHWVIASL